MKNTLNVNIGSIAFVIDEDAYYMLKDYLDDIAVRFSPEDTEVLNDVEMRIADIFMESLGSPRRVVNIELVKKAMAILGKAEEFGEPRFQDAEGQYQYSETRQSNVKRLRRSRQDRVIGGVCGGIAEYFNIDVAVVRIITLLLTFFGGINTLIYLIMWIAIPADPRN